MRDRDEDAGTAHHREKARTRLRAQRRHRGSGPWHVEVRSSVIVCRACGAAVPKHLRPRFCPHCGSGRGQVP